MKRILICNRGEIAVRVIRACRELGMTSIAVFSEPDRKALHTFMADEAYPLGGKTSAESYLVQERILDICRTARVDAIHPGYGFLSENATFTRACREAGIVFLGPPPEAMELMGDKAPAKAFMRKAGVPVTPGSEGIVTGLDAAQAVIQTIGYPVMLKATAGGGGKGMRVVKTEKELERAWRGASGEAQSAFGNPALYIEKFVERPRHIEIQILCDSHGNGVHLFERECSIQRRHQKLIEESPSPVLTDDVREKMGEVAVKAALACGYVGAGTIEFLYEDGNFYFMEMNTRLQVEHPVTELVTGLDLVKEQIRVGFGEPLGYVQADIRRQAVAIECRICAEDPGNNFLPSAGQISSLKEPTGPGVRIDTGIYMGYEVPIYYDSLLAKIITWGRDRKEAIARMNRALREYELRGITCNIPFHLDVLAHPDFLAGNFDTRFIDEKMDLGKRAAGGEWTEAETMASIAAVLERDLANDQLEGDEPVGEGENLWKRAARLQGMIRMASR